MQKLNEDKKMIYKEYFLEMEDCKRSNSDSFYYQKCIKDLDLYLSGSWTEDHISFLTFQIVKCKNETQVPDTNAKTEKDFKFLEDFQKETE